MSDDTPKEAVPVGPQIIASPIIKMTDQVGQNVLSALDQPGTVAVLSTLVPGIQADRIVSVPLSPSQLHEVHALVPEEPVAEEDMPCVGFHCEMKREPDAD